MVLDCEAAAPRTSTPPPGPIALANSRTAAALPWGAVAEFPSLFGSAVPTIPTDALGLTIDLPAGSERALRSPATLARAYAWGPSTGDWNGLGHWKIAWDWPWSGPSDVRASADTPAPWPTLDAARRGLGIGPSLSSAWSVALGDDADHALLLERGNPPTGVRVRRLESGRAPVEIRRAGGDSFPEVQAALRMGGRWFIATGQSASEVTATVIWVVDGEAAREIARVPRAGFDTGPRPRLARRADGRALGLVVEGQPEADRGVWLWVAAIDSETGTIGDPMPLAPLDLSDRPIAVCSGDEPGWQLELPYPGLVEVDVHGGRWSTTLHTPAARLRLSSERACLDGIVGAADSAASAAIDRLDSLPRFVSPSRLAGAVAAIDASVFVAHRRLSVRCWRR
jgi:hypothetical protein